MAQFKAAFVFVVPDADPEEHRVTITTPSALELIVVGVKNYQEAVEVAQGLVDQGVGAIELCAGFGHSGVAKVAEAVGDRAKVGVVRFDPHPGLDFKSGDELFE